MASSGVTIACPSSVVGGKQVLPAAIGSGIEWIAGDETNSYDGFNGYNCDDEDYFYNNWNNKQEPQMSSEEMYMGLRKVITSVMSNRDSWPFKEPINEAIAPMYYEVILNPIDLTDIKRKIEDRLYNNFRSVEDDFKLLVNNCETYNGPRNGYTLLSYAVWRVFKRAVKRFLNTDLSYDEQVAFIYPPKPNNITTKAAIEARRRRRKHRKLRALEILAKAAEEAVKYTSLRGTGQDSNGCSPQSSPFSSKSSDTKFTTGINGKGVSISIEALSDCDSNSNFPSHLNLNLNIGMDEENLTFKTLSEWSEYIRLRGEPIKLPQNSVILPHTPNSKTNANSCEVRHFRAISDKIKQDRASLITNNGWSSTSSYTSDSSYNFESPPIPVNKPIVIKLSRCSSDNGTIWKPVQIHDNGEVNCTKSNGPLLGQKSMPISKNVPSRESISNDSYTSTPKKRLALDDEVFGHNQINTYSNTQSSAELNSSKTQKLLNCHIKENKDRPCLSEESSMDCEDTVITRNCHSNKQNLSASTNHISGTIS